MKSLLIKAVASAIAIGTLASCSGPTSTASPRLLTKAETEKLVRPAAWSGSSYQAAPGLPAEVGLAVKTAAATRSKDKHGMPTYKSESVRHRVVRTTSYSHQEGEVGAPGRLNAIGTILKYGQVRSAAADWSRYPVGTTFRIKGLPHIYVVDDYGSALVGTNTIDIFHPTLSLMRTWATRPAEINVIKWGSWERTTNLLRGRTKHGHCARMYYATMARLNGSRVAQSGNGSAPTL